LTQPAGKVPVIANIRPSGSTYLMEDFYYAGGMPALMRNMSKHLDVKRMTINGKTIGEEYCGRQSP
jgi:dihydroxy-acid dehydratase